MTHEEYERFGLYACIRVGVCLTFCRMTESVRGTIAQGIHPKMISKGSSGSYFARAKTEGRIQTIGYAVATLAIFDR